MTTRIRGLALGAILALMAGELLAQGAPAAAVPGRELTVSSKPWTGDFDEMLERRQIRVYAPYSRTIYFVDKGRERGIGAELVRDFERWVNTRYAKQLGKRPVTVYIVAATRDKLLTDLPEGIADIAIGNFTVTEERKKIVDFVAPDPNLVNIELLVTGPATPPIASIEDLSGKTIHVRKASSYYESVVALNERLSRAGKAPVNIVLVPDALEDEDMLEMMNAGLLQAMVVDELKAKIWAQVLPKIKVREDIRLREPTLRGWAIRKNSPRLAAALTEFYESSIRKQNVVIARQNQLMRGIKQLNNPAGADYKRFQDTIALFQKYGKQYHFDPLMLAAQGYQESTLDQNAKSPVGAIGIMQLMPATGQELKVGDIHVAEYNIHAGAKYMDQLIGTYFKDATFDDQNRTLFAFAAYNCGPGNIIKMRALAQKRGLDPNKWFNNVEIVTAEKIGIETTTYVRNIFKYYVSYKLTQEAQASVEKLKTQVAPAPR
jgi:membrane-bound lytic murein transglycosylase MltF